MESVWKVALNAKATANFISSRVTGLRSRTSRNSTRRKSNQTPSQRLDALPLTVAKHKPNDTDAILSQASRLEIMPSPPSKHRLRISTALLRVHVSISVLLSLRELAPFRI